MKIIMGKKLQAHFMSIQLQIINDTKNYFQSHVQIGLQLIITRSLNIIKIAS